MTEQWKRSNPVRVTLVIGGIFLWSGIIIGRLAQLQILRHDAFVQLAMERQQMTRAILPPRGVIYDAHMDELATSVTVSTVAANPAGSRIKPAPRRVLPPY